MLCSGEPVYASIDVVTKVGQCIITIPYSGKFSWGPNFILCYLQLIRVFNFHSVHFTQENTPIIMYVLCVKFLF